mmetsp:Transcript_9060/g.20156  ORF Transcript_9060/g.20156 Transcript_9060/m.20156 type:complete len:216 (+) Transcript_9060:82-729(+)
MGGGGLALGHQHALNLRAALSLPHALTHSCRVRLQLVTVAKSGPERKKRRERLRAAKQRRREEAALRSQTVFDDHWYQVREDGVWQEHRTPPPEAARQPRRRRTAQRSHSFQDLVEVTLDDEILPPEEWLLELDPEYELLKAELSDDTRGRDTVQEDEPSRSSQTSGSLPRPIVLPSQPWKKTALVRRWQQQRRADGRRAGGKMSDYGGGDHGRP